MNSKTKKTYRVLILDGDQIACLSILRSLSKRHIKCDIASNISRPLPTFSKYSKKHYSYPDPLTNADSFIDRIIELLKLHHYDLVIPITERTLIPLANSRKVNPWRNRLAIANKESLDQVLDKAKTMQLAEKHGISIPFSYSVASISEVEALLPKLEYPVALKPSNSIPDAKERKHLSVTYANNDSELLKLSFDLLKNCPLLIQRYVRGIGTGIEILANQGDIVFSFQHQRIHELPLTGGGSCLRKSIAVEPILLDAAEKLVRDLNWHGVAMVEFKWQPDTGEYWLMEINGRFWGSLPLAIAAGADFPSMLFDLLVFNRLPEDTSYTNNVYCRKLSADIYWIEQVLRKQAGRNFVNYPSLGNMVQDTMLMLHPTRHFFDVQSWFDPLPGLIDLVKIFNDNLKRVFDIVWLKLKLIYHASTWQKKRIINFLNTANNILFLCYGNINRSAIASAIAAQKISGKSNIDFFSAGFHAIENRPADPSMVKVASENGVDLSSWQSTSLTPKMIEQADIILAMELQHLQRLGDEYPEAKKKSFLLGSLVQNGTNNVEISDPYNQNSNIYKNTYSRVNLCIKELLISLK